MTHIKAAEGKYFMNKNGELKFFASELYLAVNDSADNYEEVDEEVKNTIEAEQEEKTKKELETLMEEHE